MKRTDFQLLETIPMASSYGTTAPAARSPAGGSAAIWATSTISLLYTEENQRKPWLNRKSKSACGFLFQLLFSHMSWTCDPLTLISSSNYVTSELGWNYDWKTHVQREIANESPRVLPDFSLLAYHQSEIPHTTTGAALQIARCTIWCDEPQEPSRPSRFASDQGKQFRPCSEHCKMALIPFACIEVSALSSSIFLNTSQRSVLACKPQSQVTYIYAVPVSQPSCTQGRWEWTQV